MISGSLLSLANGSIEQWIVDTLWATTLLMLAALMLRKPVARFFGPEIAYLLWAAPVIRLFMPPLTQTVIVPASNPAEPVWVTPLALDELANTVAPASPDWMTIAFTLWIGGAALFLVTQIAAYLQHRRELLEDARPVGFIGNIQLVEISNISGPFAFGLWQRFIALPIGFNRQFDPVERDLALAHEQSHHRAGDLWMNFIGLILLALHWFNPVAWIAWRSFRFDQEAACDARVIRGRPALERAAYARAIAKAATGRTLALASPLNPRHRLVTRLKLMSGKDHSLWRKRAGLALLGTASAGAMVMSATVTYAFQPEAGPVPMQPEPIAVPQAPQAPASPHASGDMAGVAPLPPAKPVPPVEPLPHDNATSIRDDRQISHTEWERRIERAEYDRAHAGATAIRAKATAQAAAHAGSTSAQARSGQSGFEIIGAPHSNAIRVKDCDGRSHDSAFMTQYHQRDGKTVKTSIVTCGQMAPDLGEMNAHIEASMERAHQQMAKARTAIERNQHIPAADRAEALADLDQDMADLRREMEDVKREIKREMQEAQRETRRELEEARRARTHS